MGIVINGEYYSSIPFEDIPFSEDPVKNDAMVNAFMHEIALMEEWGELYSNYSYWVQESCHPDYDGSITREEALEYSKRIDEIEKELETLLDGTGISEEEYEAAKKLLFPDENKIEAKFIQENIDPNAPF